MNSGQLIKAKFKAFCVHIVLSAGVALIALWVIFVLWYPGLLAEASGVTGIVVILLGVDIVLGAGLTCLIYRPRKKSLLFDLTCIVLLQIGALIYGMLSIAAARPAWVVFNVDRFDLVQLNMLDEKFIRLAAVEYQVVGWQGPRWVVAKLPADITERNALLFDAVAGGPDLPLLPQYFDSIEHNFEQIVAAANPVTLLNQYNAKVDVDMARMHYPEASCWLPLKARKSDMVVLINCVEKEIVGIADLRPWL